MLPAAVSLRNQGASKGAVTSFLISTPESGVDSIAITYALLDPLMTVARPVAAFFTAVTAGLAENLTGREEAAAAGPPDLSCPVDGCCDGVGCPPEVHRRHHSLARRVAAGMRYAYTDFWGDLSGSFAVGLLLAGAISALIPESFFTDYLGGGPAAMGVMLAAGIPLYICATASTPIAAALILKGVSPGAALVFLLAGPATNMAAVAVLARSLGKRSTAVYLAAIAVCAVLSGLVLDALYQALGISARAAVGEAAEVVPHGVSAAAALVLVVLALAPVLKKLSAAVRRRGGAPAATCAPGGPPGSGPSACQAQGGPT